MSAADPEAWLDGARRGEEWAITCLFRSVYPSLYSYLHHRSPDVAEDLASETWLAAAKGFASFAGDFDEFRALLFSIARRRVADHYRRQARRPAQVALEETSDPLSPDAADVAMGELSNEEAIRLLVQDLPREQAEVILLRIVGDLSVAHTAAVVGRSAGAVRALQHRALRRLAKKWSQGAVTR